MTTANAGVEAFMLNVASEASTGFSRAIACAKELARMGTVTSAKASAMTIRRYR